MKDFGRDLLVGSVLFVAACQTPPVPSVRVPATSTDVNRDEAFGEALTLLTGAYFPHQASGDLAAATAHASVLGQDEGSSSPWRAKRDYLEARIAGILGDFGRAARLGRRAAPGLGLPFREELLALIPFWEVMVYSQGDGLFHYDEDVRIENRTALMARPEIDTEQGKRLYRQAVALYNRAQLLATGAMSTAKGPIYAMMRDQLVSELREAFCTAGDAECPELELLKVHVLAGTGAVEQGRSLAERLAEKHETQGRNTLAATCWMWAGDLLLAPHSGPFELRLRPLNSSETTMALNNGLSPEEFASPSKEEIQQGIALYQRARSAMGKGMTGLVAAHLTVREAFVQWCKAQYEEAANRFAKGAKQLRALGSARDAHRSEAAALIAAVISDADSASSLLEWEKAELRDKDYGVVLGTARLLDRAALYAHRRRYDVRAAYLLRESGIAQARGLGATQRTGALLMEQASLLKVLGRFHDALVNVKEAVLKHRRYLDVIDQILIFQNNPQGAADEKKGVQLVTYSEVMDLVNLHLQIGELDKAEEANEWLKEIERQGVSPVHGQQSAINEILIAIHRTDLERALVLAERSGDEEMIGTVLLMMDRHKKASRIFSRIAARALREVRGYPLDGDPVNALRRQILRSQIERALAALLRAGQSREAARVFEESEAVLGSGTTFSDSEKPYEREHLLARIEAASGRDESARKHFETAVETLEKQAGLAARIRTASPFDSEVRHVYADYFEFLFRIGKVEKGVESLERYRAREFQDVLIVNALMSDAVKGEMREWLRAESEVEMLVRSTSSADRVDDGFLAQKARLSSEAAKAREKVLAKLSDTGVRESAFDGIVSKVVQLVDETETTLVVYHLFGATSSAVVLRPGKPPVVRPLKIKSFELVRSVDDFVSDLQPESADVDWKKRADHLYRLLLHPIADLLPDAGAGHFPRLGIIPYGDAHRVPFHALTDRRGPLVNSYNIFYSPSLLSYLGSTRVAAGTGKGLTLRAIGYNGTRLRNAESEALKIDPDAWVGDAATQAHLLAALKEKDGLFVAVHAVTDPANPLLSSLFLSDGELRLHDLRGNQMRSSLIVLSACETAVGERQRSDQLTGLVTPFLENGVPLVVATGWAIDDELTNPLMLDFRDHLKSEQDAVDALAAAQRAALSENGDRSHPAFWSAFFAIGRPR